MIYLLLDLLVSSITYFKTSFILFDINNKHSYIYVLFVSLLVLIYTHNLIYIVIIFIIYNLNKVINNKYLRYLLGYLILFNININISNFISFIMSIFILFLI